MCEICILRIHIYYIYYIYYIYVKRETKEIYSNYIFVKKNKKTCHIYTKIVELSLNCYNM